MDTSSISPQDYYNSAPFDGFSYSSYVQAYYFTTGVLSTIGNLYIIILFVTFSKLRQLQCNWLIVFLCTCDVLVGIGTLIRGSTIVYAKNNLIVYIPTYTCSLLIIPFVMGYRVGQAIALMIALDRFVAIWKPFSYNKYQGPKTTLIFGIIGILIAGLLIFLIFYGADLDSSETLDNCNSPLGVFYFQVVPSYSGIVSVLFFGFYLTSLITLYRHLAATKKQQVHAQENLSRVQLKVFITVSYALFCYSIFYGVPTILQMLSYYFNFDGWVADYSTYLIIYGGEFNGILNALIYIFKHQEFANCSKQIIHHLTGKMKPVSSINNHNTTQGRSLFKKSDKSLHVNDLNNNKT